jgi:hypothetical protein
LIDFVPHPEIAMSKGEYDPSVHKAIYKFNYREVFKSLIDAPVQQQVGVFKRLIEEDLFFVVLAVMQIPKANHPFVVNRCMDVQDGAGTDTLDVWARFHWKSTIITIGETIQYHLKHPDHCTCIMAYARPLAKKFLESIKNVFETSGVLKGCFPESVWQKPEVEAPSWSLDGGLRLKGASASRKESTIEAFGLIEGQPTGRHYERVVFDDLETDDIRESPDMLEKVYSKFEMAGNLGTGSEKDITRIIGTYYSHFGPMIRIRDRKYQDGRPMYSLRLIPGSDNGKRDGTPIWMDQKNWDKEKTSQFFNSQQLCDPTPLSELKLDFRQLKKIEVDKLPRNLYKFMVLDQAGGDETAKASRDMWSYGVVGVRPQIDDIGQSDVYLLDVEADKMSHAEGIDGVTRMYLRNGIINQLGVEKVGLSTTEIHITNALRAYGRRISLDARNLVLLKPGGRSKEFRVESALQWPMNNGKLWYSDAIHTRYIQAIEEEMMKFPFFHVDILDMWAYVYDLIKTFHFVDYRDEEFFNVPQEVDFHGMSSITGY